NDFHRSMTSLQAMGVPFRFRRSVSARISPISRAIILRNLLTQKIIHRHQLQFSNSLSKPSTARFSAPKADQFGAEKPLSGICSALKARDNRRMNRARLWVLGRWVLTIFGALSIIYCLAVLGFVSTAPDLGLRCLLVSDDDGTSRPLQKGLQIR